MITAQKLGRCSELRRNGLPRHVAGSSPNLVLYSFTSGKQIRLPFFLFAQQQFNPVKAVNDSALKPWDFVSSAT
jgi:hypothetical protein